MIEEELNWKQHSLKNFLDEGNYPSQWLDFFTRNDIQEELEKISEFLYKEAQTVVIYPSIKNVFRAFYETDMKKMKAVILGQDCYHNGSAVGLCFSVPSDAKINPSLYNIYKELENEGYEPNKNGDLSHLAKQGCLMLNTALTVEKARPESHIAIWYNFSEKLIEYISKHTKNIAWILMGSKAYSFNNNIKELNGHAIFVSSHPSPFSALKPFKNFSPFIGSGIFKKANDFLQERKINW